MKENLIEDNIIIENNLNTGQNKDNIPDNSFIRSIVEISNQNMNKKSSKMLKKTMHHIKKQSKLHRYKIGLIFYIIYIVVDIAELVLTILTEYDFDYDPFCETYIRYGAFAVFLLISPFLNKSNSSLFDMMNLTKYYIPDWKKKKNGNLSSVFYVFEGTEEKFNKTVHKISFLFTVLVYISMSFYLHSYIQASKDYIHKAWIYLVKFLFY